MERLFTQGVEPVEIKDKIGEIHSEIIAMDFSNLEIGPMGGKSGIALFLCYFSRYFKNQKAADIALELLYSCISDIEKGGISFSYSGGLTGFGSILQHLSEMQLLDVNTDDILGELDDPLIFKMTQCLEDGNIDFLHGALGVAYYFLKRNKKEVVINLVHKLLEQAEKEEDGIYWRTEMDVGKRMDKGINFGLAHGIFSIVSFFNKIIADDYLKEEQEFVRARLSELNTFILNRRLPEERLNCFPTWKTTTSEMNYSRLAWCYGDLSAGLVLLESAILNQDKYWYKESICILRKTLNRTNVEQESVLDAGFCHGSSGLSYLYYKIYKLTNLKEFLHQSNYWLNDTFQKNTFADGYAGYKAFHQTNGWHKDAGLLQGVSGIGLVLLSRIDNHPPDWDSLLLI